MDFMDAYKGNFITRNWERLKTFRKPVIAAVSGVALGGGCEAMMCDIVFAADCPLRPARVKIGTLPGAGGTQRLPRAVGKAKAMDLVLRGRMMDAAEAERCGLVSQVVPADSLLDEALAAARASPALAAGADDAQGIRQSRLRKPLGEGLLFERRTLHTRASRCTTRRKAWRPSPKSARPASRTAEPPRQADSPPARRLPRANHTINRRQPCHVTITPIVRACSRSPLPPPSPPAPRSPAKGFRHRSKTLPAASKACNARWPSRRPRPPSPAACRSLHRQWPG
jgi:hypothetical protein